MEKREIILQINKISNGANTVSNAFIV